MKSHKEFLIDGWQHYSRRDDAKLAFGGLLLGGVAAAVTSNILVGGAIAVLGYGLAGKQIFDDSKRLRIMGQTGAVAPFLKGEDYQEYVDTFGTAEADRQAMHVLRFGLKPTGIALEGLEERNPGILDKLEEAAIVQPGKVFFNPELPSLVNASLNPTKLEAFSQPQVIPDAGYKLANPVEVLGDRLRSILLIAPTGAGKGILISNLIRHFKGLHPDLKVFAFDGKNMAEETGYWTEGFDEVVRVDLDRADPVHVAHWVMRLIERAHTTASDSILLLDELNALIRVLDNGKKHCARKLDKELCGQALGTVLRKLATAASTGDGRNNHVWGIGQVPNLSALGLNGGEANQLRKAAIALNSNPVHTDQLVMDTNFTGTRKDAEYREGIKQAIALSPIGRAFYDSATAKWYAMPILPNYSGFDRDNRQQVERPESPNLPKSLILVGHGSESATVLQQSTATRIQEPSATVIQKPVIPAEFERDRQALGVKPEDAARILQEQLQRQGLLYQPPSTATEIAEPPSNVVHFPKPSEPETPLESAVKELISKLKALPAPLRQQANDMKPLLQQVITDKRDDLVWICALSCEKGEVTARMVRERMKFKPWFKELEATGTNINESIRGKFSELSDLGVGDCFGEGNRLSYLLFTGDDRTLTGEAEESGDTEEVI